MNPDTVAALRDVYNESQRIKREKMKGKTVIQHLWYELSESGYNKWHRTNPAGDAVQDVMFAHPDSIKLLQLFPYVILMDCTYKTNRYEMPLLEIIGVTPVGRNFTIAVAFMSREDEDIYAWTLRCLRDILPIGIEPEVILTNRELGLLKALPNVFPHSHHMLCLYHINRNVEANPSKFLGNTKLGVLFRMTVWAKLVEYETEEEYECNYREVESAHRASKRWIQTSTGAMDTVQNALDAQVDLQINELKVKNESSRTVRMNSSSLPCFGALLHPFWRTLVVEPKSDPWEDEEEPFDRTVAIKKVLLDEFEKLSNKDYMSLKNAANYLRDLNNHSSTHLQEPSFVKANGRPKNNSTKRNLSGYEHMMNRKSEVKSSLGSKGRKTPTEGTLESKLKAGTPESKVKGRPRGRTKSTEESVVTAGDRVNFFSFLPPFLAQSVASYVNVRADGNCGYRCIAEVVYGSQERWPQVRTDLVEEFMERYNLYSTIYGGDEGGRNTVDDYILTCSHESGPAPRTK
ncbi:PREDICTED: uncharacterized protein LOC105953529 [Erythranthe guttata]|uniref:uncharacterized protein LOC105953529 n=1 Tax=Erythranthe guttata TaxID=4155 RepID=UPI00064E0FFC|nr:PREDICTED: uncharacterized protein LOC105953529 [Erythranthe guttata]|eukprot:XP_012832655.1 PREDICTED: uncharacterized protein LOC105953529 [Erythranthe guttata]